MKFWDYIKSLVTYGVTEASEAADGEGFLDGEDDDDADTVEGEGREADELDDEEDEDEDLGDESDEDEDDEEDAESEDDTESEGEGGEEDGGAVALAKALREATRARLEARRSQKAAPKGVNVNMPSIEDLKKLPGLEDIDGDDLKVIHGIAAAVVESALSSYHDEAVVPMTNSANEEARKRRIISNLQDFKEKYPTALDTHQDEMAAIWDEFSNEFGRDAADEIPFEDLYIMAGGKGAKAAKSKAKGVAQKLATEQKKKATRGQQQAGRVGKVRSGGKRTKSRGGEAARATEYIRRTKIVPFTMP